MKLTAIKPLRRGRPATAAYPLLILLVVSLLASCGGPAPLPNPDIYLLIPNMDYKSVEVMTAVTDAGSLAPDAKFTLPGNHTPTAALYGPDGRIYVIDATAAEILVYDAAQALAQANPVPVATLTSTAFVEPAGLAFSPLGKLWVVDRGDSDPDTAPVATRLLRFAGTSGAVGTTNMTPEAALELGSVPATIFRNNYATSILFDALGNLWLTDLYDWSVSRIDDADSLVGSLTDFLPDLMFAAVNDADAPNSPIRNPTSLAFDRQGRLYVGNRGGVVVSRFDDPDAITTLARSAEPSAVIHVGGAAIVNSAQMGIDSSGDLWVASGTNAHGFTSELVRLPNPGQGSGDITITPTKRFEWAPRGYNWGGSLLFEPPTTQVN